MIFTISTIDDKVIPTQTHLIQNEEITQTSRTKIPILFLTLLYKISLVHPNFNIRPPLPAFSTPFTKVQLGEFDGTFKTKTKTNEALREPISQLNSKFKSMSSHHKMMEIQLTQIAQQVSHLSRFP